MQPITRAIIVLDQTSGSLREDEDRILGFDLTPSVRTGCADTLAGGIETILVVPGLTEKDLTVDFSGFVPAGVRVIGVGSLSYFATGAAASFSGEGEGTALVSADRRLRGDARLAGFVPAPHPALLPMLAKGAEPRAARFVGAKAALERLAAGGDFVPMQFQPAGGTDWSLIALTTADRLADAILARLTLQPIEFDSLTEDLFWARIDHPEDRLRDALMGRRILYAEPGQVLIALGPDDSADAFHFHGAHGHSEFLAPDPGLVRTPVSEGAEFELPVVGRLPEILEAVEIDPAIRRLILMARPSCQSVTAQYAADLDRYSGVAALDASGPIVSRHSRHPDNKRAEAALLADLRAMGYCASRHEFTHAGETHSNIIADLPGVGRFRIRPDILERYRRILREPFDQPPIGQLPKELAELLGDSGLADGLAGLPDRVVRSEVERILKLYPWYPWWKIRCPVPGIGAGLVVVGAHMDSTAGFEAGYSAPLDPAPGRDDNASGLAGVLSLARYFRTLAGRLTHTVRFCFFNAEESGLVGSKAYASHLKALGAPVRGVICMDMIGYNSDLNQFFEIHAGYTDPAIRDLSLLLADLVAQAAADYGRLAPAQIYRGTSWTGAPDRTVYDGAINRSDHAAFHQQGYGAVLASEDFFMNLPSEPAADPNPNYHRAADQITDTAYARAIVCAVARAVTKLAAER